MHGVRDVDGPERVALDLGGVHLVEDAAQLAGLELFVHLDLDVLDPAAHPAQFPVDGGLSRDELLAFLTGAAEVATIVGAEVTAAAPGHAEPIAKAIAPLVG